MARNATIAQMSLREILQQHTIAELKNFLNELALKIKSGLKKDFMVKVISQWMLAHTDIVVTHLLTYELRMYADIINHPEKELLIPETLIRFPFDGITLSDNDTIKSYIATDLAEKLQPLLADEIARREQSGEEAVENHIIGLSNLRGAVPYDEYLDYLSQSIKDDDSMRNVMIRIHRFTLGNDIDDELVIASPFMFESDFNVFDEFQVDPDIRPKDFTSDEIAKAAMMPHPQIGGVVRDNLKKQLLKLDMSEKTAEEFLFYCWREKQNGIMNLLHGIKILNYYSFEQAQEILALLKDFANKMPFWKFKGWSSEEIAAKGPKLKPGQLPHIVMGPNMRAKGITSFGQLQEMAARGEEFPGMPFPPTKKVGRNDPCPCGSGKKYKNCCGR